MAAGVLSFDDALRLVRRRGELMAAASEGTMAAIIGLELDVLRQISPRRERGRVVVVANENSPGQLVISGAARPCSSAMALAREHGARRALPLNVAAAFHSPLMEQAARPGGGTGPGRGLQRGPIAWSLRMLLAEPLGEAHAVPTSSWRR